VEGNIMSSQQKSMLTPRQAHSSFKTQFQAAEIERKRAEKERTRYANQLQGLADISLIINSSRSTAEILKITTEKARDIIGAHQSVASFTVNENWAQAIQHVSLSDKYAAWRDYSEKPDGSGIYAQVCRVGRSMRLTQADLERHPAWKRFGQAAEKHPPMCGWLAAPLIQPNGQNIGLLQLSDKYEGEFSESDEAILIQLAQMVSVAIENAQLFEAERHQREVAEMLRDLVVTVNSTLDIDQVLNLTVQRLKVLHQASACSMSFLTEDGETFFFRASTDPGLDLSHPLAFPANRSVAGQAIRERKVQIINNVDEAPNYRSEITRRTHIVGRSLLTAPLFATDKPLGVIQVLNASINAFNKADAEFLATTAALIETALARAQAYTQAVQLANAEHRQRKVAETLRQAGAIITSSLQQNEIIERILEQLARVVPYDSAAVQLLRDGYLETVGGRGWSNPEVVRGLRYPVPGPNPNTVVIQERRPHILSEIRSTSSEFSADYYSHIQSWLGVPLVAHDRVIGMLTLDSSQLAYFTPDHAQLTAAFADQVAIALENARLFEAEHQAHQLAEILRTANLALTRTLELETVLETLLDYLGQLVPYDSACVMLLEIEDRLVVRASRGYERWSGLQMNREFVLDISTYLNLDALLTSRVGMLIADTREYPHWNYHTGADHVRNWLGVPLVAGGKVLGLYSVDKVDPNFFTQEHLRSAEVLAAQAAVAIENALLFNQVDTGRQQLRALSHRLVEVQEVERRYIARELHDEIGQILTGLKLMLDTTARLSAQTLKRRLGEAQALINELMERVDELSLDLRPAMLDDLGLLPALLWHFKRYTRQTHIQVIFKHRDLEHRRFIPKIETTVYRLVQEALTNVARHAGVSEARVHLWADQNVLSVEIEDQGTGFDPLAPNVSAGLSGMRERVILLDGQLIIESAQEKGTYIRVELPLSDPVEAGKLVN
jgi:signal transduction histidine kinase